MAELIVILPPTAITLIGPAEIDQSVDVDLRSGLIVGAEGHSARRDLKAQIADRLLTNKRDERPDQRMVGGEAAAARAGVGEPARIESIARLAIIGERIAQHGRAPLIELVVDLP